MAEKSKADAPAEPQKTEAQVESLNEARVVDWSRPKVDPSTGYEMIGDFPATRAARLQALASDHRRKSDPDGIVSDEDIAAYRGESA